MAYGIDLLTRLVKNLFKEEREQWNAITAAVTRLERKLQDMPTRAEFDAAKAALMQAVKDEAAQVQKALQDLRDQIANGNPVTDQDLADIQQLTADVAGIDPDQVVPTP